jgi:hypothetical protein
VHFVGFSKYRLLDNAGLHNIKILVATVGEYSAEENIWI